MNFYDPPDHTSRQQQARPEEPTDQDLRERLVNLDRAPEVVTTEWEAQFIESVVFQFRGDLSNAQRRKALEILDEYGF